MSDNKPFYVGKGKDSRAWNNSQRNIYWKRVVEKHGKYVEIVFDNLTESEAFQCEIDTILELDYFQYKLTNMTKGGEGASGYKFSKELREALSEKARGRLVSASTRAKLSLAHTGFIKDKNIYKIKHSLTDETFIGNRDDIAKYIGVELNTLTHLFSRRTYKQLDYCLISCNGVPTQSPSHREEGKQPIYTFVHKSGTTFTGTRIAFCFKYSLKNTHVCHLFKVNPIKATSGWGVMIGDETADCCINRLNSKRKGKT